MPRRHSNWNFYTSGCGQQSLKTNVGVTMWFIEMGFQHFPHVVGDLLDIAGKEVPCVLISLVPVMDALHVIVPLLGVAQEVVAGVVHQD